MLKGVVVKVKEVLPKVWRDGLARLPLPMLALAASYGVYRFAAMFVPEWVAIVQAAAFELVYMGLAVVRGLTPGQYKRAKAISLGSVGVSVAYNSLDGLLHRRPDLLVGAPLWADIGLALLHGAPLAVVAYLVADLLLHSGDAHNQNAAQSPKALLSSDPLRGGRPNDYTVMDILALASDGVITRELVLDRLGCSDTTASRLFREGVQLGKLARTSPGVYQIT